MDSAVLRPANLRDQVLGMIRQSLIAGEIKAGDIYSAAALATHLGVSSSPVREALLTLVSEGLMEPIPNRGYRVVGMTNEDLNDLYDLRLLVEVPGTVRGAQRASAADLERLDRHVQAIDAAVAKGDVVGFLQADRAFHLDLLSLAGNTRLSQFVAQLRDQTRLYGMAGLAEKGTLSDSAGEHRQMMNAIRAQDFALVEHLIREHLRHVRDEWA